MTDRETPSPEQANQPDFEAYAHFRHEILTRVHPSAGPARLLATVALLSTVFVVAGAFGPWMHVEEVRGNTSMLRGVQTDGAIVAITGVIAFVAFTLTLVGPSSVPAALTGLIASAASALIGAYSWMIFDQSILGYEGTSRITQAETGWGLPLTTAAAAITTIVAVALLRRVENT